MATFVFHRATRDIMKGDVDLDTKAVTVVFVGTANTISSGGANGADAATVSLLTGLDEYTGTNYARINLTSGGTTIAQDDANTRSEWLRDDVSISNLSSSANGCGAFLLYLGSSSDNDTDNVPLAYLDLTSFNGNGGNVSIAWNGQGILQYSAIDSP